MKEKLLAAHRIGITTIILPRENEKDLADIPKNVLDAMTVELVEHVDEVLKIALVPPAARRRRRRSVEPAAGDSGDVAGRHDALKPDTTHGDVRGQRGPPRAVPA